MSKIYKRLNLEVEEELIKLLKDEARNRRIYLSALVEEYLYKVLEEKELIEK